MSFLKSRDEKFLKISSSLHHDSNIKKYDLLVNAVHTLNLAKSGYISSEEAKEILTALSKISKIDFEGYEDVEEAVESEVVKITDAGKKMHTALSRNDEVATCLRMFARDKLLELAEKVCKLRSSILKKAEENINFLMPGFTHFQPAQPTRISHHLLAYVSMLERDFRRIIDAFKRSNLCPLGSAAFASSPYNLDRSFAAELLGFDDLIEHSEDAVSSRDFLIESVYVAAQLLLDLSRIAEEIVLFSNPNFNYIKLPEEFSSTSSIMPQKKNPDLAELLRARASKLVGNLTAAMCTYKALPFSYNRDFQEMNPILYDSLIGAVDFVEVFSSMFEKLEFNREKLKEDSSKFSTTATGLADYLVINFGIPFRIAYKIVGKHLKGEKIEDAAREFGYDVKIDENLDAEFIVESRKNIGGTCKKEVERMMSNALEKLSRDVMEVERYKKDVENRILKLRKILNEMGVETWF
ncbi:MAG: argininosuccinate lyase [Archaeoglobaceae archaeon]|nr:argininosuccinate lyase [Archaeoglobaceae archaeon]MCX8151844.1 argininosuccinate lyase [Archaeoglobaceae archaeon]MDW8014324.1 argininosuccinate lyase [Archaeoglobaceae archaeon]